MFVYSLKASTIKFFGAICVAMAALITLIVFVPIYDGGDMPTGADASINYTKIKDNAARRDFLGQFGWETSEKELEAIEISIPREFDSVMSEYNEIQKRQGLDLQKYKGKTVQRYTYEIKNYEGYDGTVYANLIVYKNRVIGGDICTADVSGFIRGFEK
ncbi:MAG: DUF4830 domain-containing protein [Clostridia bacterium]|nr:DUF4830 domain-containing protein [Clostridia bacterium]